MGTLVPFPYTCTTCKKKKKRKKIISHATTKQALCSSNHPSPQLTLILSKLHNHFLNKNLLRKLILLIPVPPYHKGRHSSFPTPRGIDSPSNFSKKKKKVINPSKSNTNEEEWIKQYVIRLESMDFDK